MNRRPLRLAASLMTLLASCTLQLEARRVDPDRSTLTGSATSAPADGASAITVTVTARNAAGMPLSGRSVSFRLSGPGEVRPASGRTGADGRASAEIRSGAAGAVTVSASVDGVELRARLSLAFVATHALACAPATVVLSPGTTTTVTCTVSLPAPPASAVRLEAASLPAHLAVEPFAATLEALPAGDVDVAVGIGATGGSPTEGEEEVRVVASVGAAAAVAPVVVRYAPPAPRIRTVYLVPTDRKVDPDALRGMERAQRHLQVWFASQLGSGRTLDLAYPVVEVRHSSHDSAWYASNPEGGNPALYFWFNALADAGAPFYDPENVWNVYLPVQNPPDQPTGGAGGVTLLPLGDVQGVAGQNGPVCRWTGGLGHELGHALGLPHPPGCDASLEGCDTWALMWLGYSTYPETHLTAAELTALGVSPFLPERPVTARRFDCASLDSY